MLSFGAVGGALDGCDVGPPFAPFAPFEPFAPFTPFVSRFWQATEQIVRAAESEMTRARIETSASSP